MHIALVRPAPSLERNPELVGASGSGKEFGFINPKGIVEHLDRRDRRFADTDDSDFVRLYEDNVHLGHTKSSKGGSRHPARRASSDDDDPALT
jgi:hypothetical protein